MSRPYSRGMPPDRLQQGDVKVAATRSDRIMRGYYKERAPVYDRVYAYPEYTISE